MEGIKARIKRLCNLMEPSISVMELERILGFGNGAIGKWEKTDRVPYNRVVAVAEYLHTTPEYLMTGETKTETSVERVKSICKERKIPLSRVEADLGFANGYIDQLKKGTFPDDRLVMIAEYLGIPVSALLGGATGMPTEKPRYTIIVDEDLLERIDEDLLEKIDDFRFENRYPSRSAATIDLIRLGIAALDKQAAEQTKVAASGGGVKVIPAKTVDEATAGFVPTEEDETL